MMMLMMMMMMVILIVLFFSSSSWCRCRAGSSLVGSSIAAPSRWGQAAPRSTRMPAREDLLQQGASNAPTAAEHRAAEESIEDLKRQAVQRQHAEVPARIVCAFLQGLPATDHEACSRINEILENEEQLPEESLNVSIGHRHIHQNLQDTCCWAPYIGRTADMARLQYLRAAAEHTGNVAYDTSNVNGKRFLWCFCGGQHPTWCMPANESVQQSGGTSICILDKFPVVVLRLVQPSQVWHTGNNSCISEMQLNMRRNVTSSCVYL